MRKGAGQNIGHSHTETLALGRGKAQEMDGHRDFRRIGAMGIQGMG